MSHMTSSISTGSLAVVLCESLAKKSSLHTISSSGKSNMSSSYRHKLCNTHVAKTESTSKEISEMSNRNNLLNLHFNIPNALSITSTCRHWLCVLLKSFYCRVRFPQSRNGVISHSRIGNAESPSK
jgi:hypothetical protein